MNQSARAGRLSRTLTRLFMKQAVVTQVDKLGDTFQLVTLHSSEFEGLLWTPGQKIQIAMGSVFIARTFTPIDWNAQTGHTRLLGYLHGNGPGSTWVANATPGLECDIFGPRDSVDVSHVTGPCVVMGDETSIGLIRAMSHHGSGRSILRGLLEVKVAGEVSNVLAHLDLFAVELFERQANDGHLERMAGRLPEFIALGATFVLTGKASSIQEWRRTLKTLGVPASRLITKPYWALGKAGMD